jgi:RNA polymerase sigma factor (sigma-70 family)
MQQIAAQLSRPIVLSDRAVRQLARVRQAERRHLQAEGRAPTVAELSAATGLEVEHIEALACTERRGRALEEPLSGAGDGGDTFGDLLADPAAEDAYERVPQRIMASDATSLMNALSERERRILRGRFGIEGGKRTLRELGAELGVSAERVRQIEQCALGKLYKALNE